MIIILHNENIYEKVKLYLHRPALRPGKFRDMDISEGTHESKLCFAYLLTCVILLLISSSYIGSWKTKPNNFPA
jgi:hypothetical protein